MYFFWSTTGSYAEYCLVDEKYQASLSNNLSFNQGAAVGIPYFTAYRALVHKAGVKPGQSVLVHGASGAVSNFLALLAVHCLVSLLLVHV